MNHGAPRKLIDTIYGYPAYTTSSEKFHNWFFSGNWWPDYIRAIHGQIRSQVNDALKRPTN